MGRPQQITDQEVLAAARAAFLRHGPSVSTATIAEQAGLSQAAVFKRFGTKENLMLRALAPEPWPEWLRQVDAGPDDRPITDQLHAIGTGALRFFRGVVPCLMVLRASGLGPECMHEQFDEPPPLRTRRILASWFEQAAARGQLRCDDPADLALHFMGALHVRAFLGHLFADASPVERDEDYVAQLVDTMWNGIAPRGDG